MNKTIIELTESMQELGVSKSAAKLALKKRNYSANDIAEATDTVYGITRVAKCDWEARVLRMRELIKEGHTQKVMAQMLVKEDLFGGMATAKQCMPYIKMAQEWARQEWADEGLVVIDTEHNVKEQIDSAEDPAID